MKTIDVAFSTHISKACKEASALAAKDNEAVQFTFNDVLVVVCPGEDWRKAEDRWWAEYRGNRVMQHAREALHLQTGLCGILTRNELFCVGSEAHLQRFLVGRCAPRLFEPHINRRPVRRQTKDCANIRSTEAGATLE